jgi:hypothetical protein
VTRDINRGDLVEVLVYGDHYGRRCVAEAKQDDGWYVELWPGESKWFHCSDLKRISR